MNSVLASGRLVTRAIRPFELVVLRETVSVELKLSPTEGGYSMNELTPFPPNDGTLIGGSSETKRLASFRNRRDPLTIFASGTEETERTNAEIIRPTTNRYARAAVETRP